MIFQRPVKNLLVEDSFRRRFHVWQCETFGCITTARYYPGMPQSHCRRCGKKTYYAASFCEEYVKPWDVYE